MSRRTTLVAAVFVALVAVTLFAPAAFAGSVAILNCSARKVRLCAYDKTDVVMKLAASQGDLAAGGTVIVTCNSSGGCKVKVQSDTVSNCTAGTNDTNLVGATSMSESAYRLRADGSSHYVFDKLADDLRFFDGGKHRSCTASRKVGESCQGGADCIDGGCLPAVTGGSVCCKQNCGTAACQSCAADGQSCTPTPYGKNGQYCDQSWQMCDGNRCVWRASVENGKGCVGPLECKSGFCVDGVCCNSKCDGACQSCSAAGAAGTCGPSERGKDDNGRCKGLCDGKGQCLRGRDARCSGNADCFSGHCVTDARFPGKGVKICL